MVYYDDKRAMQSVQIKELNVIVVTVVKFVLTV